MKANLPAKKKQIRAQMRTRRAALSRHDQHIAAIKIAKIIKRQPLFQRSRHIATYLANDGEIDPYYLMPAARSLRKSCYLPAISRGRNGKLEFRRFQPGCKLIANHFGIPEPLAIGNNLISPQRLNIVLMPLVAFDRAGGRLGMGGGFYDRTFAFKAKAKLSPPLLIGLAHDFQCSDSLPTDTWDIPMHAVITESCIFTGPFKTDNDPYQRDFLTRDRFKALK